MLAATLYIPADAHPGEAPKPGLIVGHGAGSNRRRHSSFCREACSAGMVVLALDFRGHGESGGEVDGPLEEDLLAAAALLRSHPLVDQAALCYRGSSMGGYYGLQAALDARFSALALLCPTTERVLLSALDKPRDPDDQARGGLAARWNNEAMRAYLSLQNVLALAERIESPTILVHARGDEVVPLRDTLELAARLAGPTEVVILPGGGHTTAQSSHPVHRRVVRWLLRQTRRSDSAGVEGISAKGIGIEGTSG